MLPKASQPDSGLIVLPRWMAFTVMLGIIMFALGGIYGYQAAVNQAALRAVSPLPTASASPGIDDDAVLGALDAPITVIEFGDYRCTYCKRFSQETLGILIQDYGDKLRFVYRDFPALGGQQEAEASQCANDQNSFWQYHEALFSANQPYSSVDQLVTLAGDLQLNTDTFRNCLETGKYRDEVRADYQEGRNFGITGTPTFFINGVRVIGAQPLSVFQSVIDQQLALGGS